MSFSKTNNSIIALSILCLLLYSTCLSALEKPGLNLTPDEWTRLKKGELILRIEEFENEKGGKGARTKTFSLVNATPDEVWKVLYEPDKDFKWAPNIVTSEITNRGENFLDIHYVLKTPFKLFQFHIHRVYHKDILLIKSNLLENEKNDLDIVDGLYALYPIEGGKKTIIYYSLYVVASPKIPTVIMDFFTKQGCKGWMENLKKRVESGGTWERPH